VVIHTRTAVVELQGDELSGLQGAVLRNRDTQQIDIRPLRHLYLFVGADPNTEWLHNCVEADPKGFVITGSSVCGVAVDDWLDVCAQCTKRVAAAMGGGADI
jgi:thioredoxin reductase (NADPH)